MKDKSKRMVNNCRLPALPGSVQQWLKVIACSILILKIREYFQFGVYMLSKVPTHAAAYSRDLVCQLKENH